MIRRPRVRLRRRLLLRRRQRRRRQRRRRCRLTGDEKLGPGEADTFPFHAPMRPSSRSRFIFTDYHTLDDCKLECNSSSASMDLSSVSGPPLSATDSSVLTSVVLPVSAVGSLNFFAGQSHGYSQLQFCSLFMSQLVHRVTSFGSLSSVL